MRIWGGLNGGKVPQLRQIQMEGWHSSLASICIDSRVSSIRRRGVVAGAVREKKSGVHSSCDCTDKIRWSCATRSCFVVVPSFFLRRTGRTTTRRIPNHGLQDQDVQVSAHLLRCAEAGGEIYYWVCSVKSDQRRNEARVGESEANAFNLCVGREDKSWLHVRKAPIFSLECVKGALCDCY